MRSDIIAVIWKEFLHFRKNVLDEVAILIFFTIFGAIPLVAFFKEGGVMRAVPLGIMMVAGLLLSGQLYSTLISEGVFGSEVSGKTLRMLLTTPINPMAIFLGKWLTLMLRNLVMTSLVIFTQFLIIMFFGGELGEKDICWVAWGAGLCILYGCYCFGTNGVLSLISRSNMHLRQMGAIVSLLPLGLIAVGLKVLGSNWDLLPRLLALTLTVLSILSFAGALLAFRMEKVRL